nr:unnamed protein product [Saccharomyces cerevisiae]
MRFSMLIGFNLLTALSSFCLPYQLIIATMSNMNRKLRRRTPPSINIEVKYDVVGKESENHDSFLEFYAEDTATLAYNVTNWEDTNITIFGVNGTIVTYPHGYPVADITGASIGPYEMEVNGTSKFGQDVTLNLPEGQYFLIPFLLASRFDEIVRIAAPPTLFEIVSPPISFFNPQFLSVQVIFLAIIGGVSYYYMKSKTNQRPSKKSATVKKVDESWLPETYKK